MGACAAAGLDEGAADVGAGSPKTAFALGLNALAGGLLDEAVCSALAEGDIADLATMPAADIVSNQVHLNMLHGTFPVPA